MFRFDHRHGNQLLKSDLRIFGLPAYVHSDSGASFVSQDLKDYLCSKSIATSHSTPYN